jgi:hypothetical protein
MNVIDARRKEILASRWGADKAEAPLQAECAVMGHVFTDFKPSKNDPLAQLPMVSDTCVVCGWKE